MRFRFGIVAVLFAAITLAVGLGATAQATSSASTVGGEAASCVPARITAAEAHSAAVVITFGDGRATLRICVKFNEDSITGLELLNRSGLTILTGSTGGGGVCAIDGTGSTDGDCFKFCKSSPCHYWAYFQRKSDAWQFSPVGAGSRTIHDGDTDGWSWGSGSGVPPDEPGAICPPPAPAPTPTPIPPTATAEPVPTDVPASTPVATATAATPRPATPSAAPTPAAQPAATADSQPTTADAPPPALDAAAPATPVNAVAGVAATPAASASTYASTTASIVSTTTPKSGVAIVEADAGLRNASAAQQRHGGGFDIVPIAGFGSVVAALAAVGGFVWYRRRQFDA